MTRKEMFVEKLPCREARMAEQGLPGAILNWHQSAFEMHGLSLCCRRLLQVPSEMGSVGIGDVSRVFHPEPALAVAWGPSEKTLWGFSGEMEWKRARFLFR